MAGPLRSQNKNFLFASLGLAVFVVVLSGAVFFRVVYFAGRTAAEFGPVLVWQAASWLPWFAVFAVAALPFAAKLQDHMRGWPFAAHLFAAVAIASASTLWFKLVSENVSPFLGLESTRFGVFPWFFIFWFFLGLFLYWGTVSFFGLGIGPLARAPDPKGKARLVVKTGKVSEVVRSENVLWIEAQDYYSVLHLKERQSWIKMTMKELEQALDPAVFVRIHRSTIVNVNHLKQIHKENTGKYSALLNDGTRRPISRHGWRDLKKILKTTQ